MKRFITYDKALKELDELKQYISLIENYEVQTLKQWIVLEYSKTNSISKVIRAHNSLNEEVLTPDQIKNVIMSKPDDELHKLVHRGYKNKIRYRKKSF